MADEETRTRVAIGVTFLGAVVFAGACALGLVAHAIWRLFA